VRADHTHPEHADAALIVGCGYLGRRLAAALVARGRTVYTTTRDQGKMATLAALGVRPLILSVTQPVTYASLTPALAAQPLDVYYLVPPGRANASPTPRQVVLGGIAHMVKALRDANVRRAVLVSSSAVYGQSDGTRVDTDTIPLPNSDRAELLLKGESLWLDAGPDYSVLRLAGLYGPGRVVGVQAVREGAPLVGNPCAMLNLIHVDDAVSLLLAVSDALMQSRIELGCDGHPAPRVEYYRYLAEKLGVPPPEAVDDQTAAARYGLNAERLSRSSNKALDNTATRQRTGWTPAYPDYRAGLDAIFHPAPQPRSKPSGPTC
jgi:nucleoside-diphosphate-sugar epimerase